MDKIQVAVIETTEFNTENNDELQTLNDTLLCIVGGGSGDVIHG